MFLGALSTAPGSRMVLLAFTWVASRESCRPQARGGQIAGRVRPAWSHPCPWDPGIRNDQSTASTSFSSVFWLPGSIQKARQGPLPAQKVLVGTHLGNGPILQHHDPISLGQDMECVSHKDPCLGKEGAELHS